MTALNPEDLLKMRKIKKQNVKNRTTKAIHNAVFTLSTSSS